MPCLENFYGLFYSGRERTWFPKKYWDLMINVVKICRVFLGARLAVLSHFNASFIESSCRQLLLGLTSANLSTISDSIVCKALVYGLGFILIPLINWARNWIHRIFCTTSNFVCIQSHPPARPGATFACRWFSAHSPVGARKARSGTWCCARLKMWRWRRWWPASLLTSLTSHPRIPAVAQSQRMNQHRI